jgi:hypothetical protein
MACTDDTIRRRRAVHLPILVLLLTCASIACSTESGETSDPAPGTSSRIDIEWDDGSWS